MANLAKLAGATGARGGVPLVVPRLLKVRETIPEMESFFDFWIERCGWAVMDYPTDRAGAVPFAGVVEMAPPKRKACRRIWERMHLRADGAATACDQDVCGKLRVGHIEQGSLLQLWQALSPLRGAHAEGRWAEGSPCATCKEWHRA
jgi:radical SAM protein with 4Fe4S-binding SPASM domain